MDPGETDLQEPAQQSPIQMAQAPCHKGSKEPGLKKPNSNLLVKVGSGTVKKPVGQGGGIKLYLSGWGGGEGLQLKVEPMLGTGIHP